MNEKEIERLCKGIDFLNTLGVGLRRENEQLKLCIDNAMATGFYERAVDGATADLCKQLQAELKTNEQQYRDDTCTIADQAQEIQRLKEKVELQADAGNWANRVFGKHQTVTGVMNHFKKECLEFFETDTPNEAADCLLLLMQHAHEKGYDLLDEGRKKHNINLNRKWSEPDSFGVIEHIKESDVKDG